MRRRNPILLGLITLIIALLLPFTVWAGGQAESEGMEGASETEQSLSLAIHDSPWLPAYRKVIEMYEEDTGVQVEVNVFPHTQLYNTQTTAAMEEDYVFDIFHMDESYVPFYMGNGYLTPIKEIDPNFEMDPNIIEYAWSTRWSEEDNYTTEDGDIYGLPVNGNMTLWFYRGDKYEEAGLPAPDTFEDVRRAAAELTTNNFYGYGIITVARIQAVYFWMPILWSFGGDIFADAPYDWSVAINSREALRSLRFLEDMKEYAPPGIGNTGQQDILSYLANGQLLQAVNVTAVHAFMDNPDFAAEPGKIDFGRPPRQVERASVLGNWIAGIPVTSEKKELALEFLEYVTSYEAQLKFGEELGVPVRSDVYEELASRSGDEWRFFRAYLETFEFARERPRIPEWPQLEEVIGTQFQEFMIGNISAEEALTEMEEGITEIMVDAGYID